VNSAGAFNIQRLKSLGHAGRLIWATLLGAVVLLMVGFALLQQIIQQEHAEIYANVLDINSKIALSDEVRIRSQLAALDKVMLVLRKDFADKPTLTQKELLQRLEELKVDNELSPRVSFADAAGKVLLTSAMRGNAKPPTFNVADRAYFQVHKTAPGDLLIVGAPILSRITGKWVVPLSRRISKKDGAFGGIVSMTVDPRLFTETFEKTSLGSDATRAILGLDGYTLLRLNGGELVYGGDTRKSQLYQEIKKSHAGCYTAIASSDGVRRNVCYRVIEPYSIIILAGSSVASMEGMYGEKVRGYVVGASLLGLLVILLSGLLMHGTVRQKKLLESQQNFNQFIELVPQMVASLDAHGLILWVNLRTVEYIKPSALEQAQGFDWVRDSVHPDDRKRVAEFVSAALLQDQCTDTCECRRRRSDGAYLWFLSRITRVVDKDGVGSTFLQTSSDIHDRKMAEERARVTQKLESIGQLTGGMAHDFNNLLAIIIGNLERVKHEVQEGPSSKRLDVAIGAAQRGVGLVKSLLALASKQPLLPVMVDLWVLVERIAPLLRHALGPRIHFELKPPGAIVHVQVDEAGLEAVLLNLIVNAKDAMPQGGHLSLGLDAANGMAHLTVQDTGTGMPEAVLKRATEPFFTTKEQGHGTGLGLSMVAGFAKQSDGSMKIHSTQGQGTTIEIFLPLVQPLVVTKASPPMLADTPAGVAASGPYPKAIGKLKILIVDDEPALAELVQSWAREDGHTAVLAHSAADALTLLTVKAFDVLLSDIIMPGHIDGIGLAQKASAVQPGLKILLMSGYSRETSTHRAAIAWPLLVKPFGKQDLQAALQKACGH
jgi:PAS domain S-box-containing protein